MKLFREIEGWNLRKDLHYDDDAIGLRILCSKRKGDLPNGELADMLGKFFWDVHFEILPEEKRAPVRRQRFRSMGREAVQTGQAPWFNQLMEGEIQIPDGTRRHFQQVTFPIKTAKGFMLGNFARDITEQKQAEAEREQLSSPGIWSRWR